MSPAEIIEKAKEATGSRSYYELSHKLDISETNLSRYRLGKVAPDFYACTKLAVTIGMDPAQLMAEFQMQQEKNETRRAFYRDFLSRARKATVVGILALISIGFCLKGPAGDGGYQTANGAAIAATLGALLYRRRFV